MNLKYYLRGLGLGIIVTAVVMGVAAGGKKTGLSDAEIKARAKELGMTESTVLSDNVKRPENDGNISEEKEPENDDLETVKAPETEEQEKNPSTGEDDKVSQDDKAGPDDKTGRDKAVGVETPIIDGEQNKADSPAGNTDKTGEQTGSMEEENGSERTGSEGTAEPVVFMINRGDGSYTVSDRLEKAGLVSSAAEFDHFLVENGYDKKIVAGEHMIPTDADGEMIVKIITGQE